MRRFDRNNCRFNYGLPMSFIVRGGKFVLVGGAISTNEECCCDNPCSCCYDTVTIDMPGTASGLSCNNSNVNDAQIDEFLGCGDVNIVLMPQSTAEGVDNACCYSFQNEWTYLCNDGNNATTGVEDEDEEEGRCYFDTPTQECITSSATQCSECDPSQPYYWERHTAAWCIRYHFEIYMCYSPVLGVVSTLIFKEQIWFRGWINVTNQCMPYDPNNPPDPPDPLPSPPCGYSSTWYELFNELAQENTWEWVGVTDVTPCYAYDGPFNLGPPTNEVLSEAVEYELSYPWINCAGSSSFIIELPAACSATSATISRTGSDTDCGNRTHNPDIPDCPGCVGSG